MNKRRITAHYAPGEKAKYSIDRKTTFGLIKVVDSKVIKTSSGNFAVKTQCQGCLEKPVLRDFSNLMYKNQMMCIDCAQNFQKAIINDLGVKEIIKILNDYWEEEDSNG